MRQSRVVASTPRRRLDAMTRSSRRTATTIDVARSHYGRHAMKDFFFARVARVPSVISASPRARKRRRRRRLIALLGTPDLAMTTRARFRARENTARDVSRALEYSSTSRTSSFMSVRSRARGPRAPRAASFNDTPRIVARVARLKRTHLHVLVLMFVQYLLQ